MGFPSYLDSGNLNGTSSNSVIIPLPGSRVNGNLLIATVDVYVTGKTFTVSPTGPGEWTIGDSQNAGGVSSAWAWRLVDGTETTPTFSWTGNANNGGQCHQFTGNKASSPIGAITQTHADASTTVTTNSITSTADNSLLLDLIFLSNSQSPAIINRNVVYNSHGFGITWIADDGNINLAGSVTDTVSVPVASCNWTTFSIEILGTGTGTAESILVSQVALEVPETYSTPVLTAQVSQVALEVPETYSTPVMQAFVSQVCIQVLRSVADMPPAPPFVPPKGGYIIERLDNRIWPTVEDVWCVDCGFSLAQPTPNADLTIKLLP